MTRSQSTLPERTHFCFAKFFILGLAMLFVISNGEFDFWPFIYWDMYSDGEPEIPKTIRRIELRILDSNQNWYSIPIKDLYTLDDDSSSQPGGKEIIDNTFLKDPEDFSSYRSYLVKYLEKELNIQIEMIEAYELTWHLNYQKYPPLEISRPDQRKKIDGFKVSDYTE
ncbi:MAG: hypothetical protein ACFBSF_14540 [Leptolyngbyaceae cyanobacterium]